MKNIMAAALATTAVLAFTVHGATQAIAQTYKDEYTISTVLPDSFPWGATAQRWADLVGDRTDGRITMRVYPGAQLVQGEQTREFTAMRQGVIDMAVGSTINWSPQVQELNLFALPFLMPDYAAMDALTGGEVGDRIFDAVEAGGVIPLAWAENGFREITNSRGPISSPEDLDGMKIRVVGSPLFSDIFSALGANPTQMSWADAQPALTTGAVDGQENPLSIYQGLQMQNVGQTYVTMWGYVADPLILGVSASVWDTFTEEDQEILREAAVEAGAYGIDLARAGLVEPDLSLIEEIEAEGVEITRLSDDQRQAFIDATRGVYNDWADRIGRDLVDMAEEAIAAR